METRSTRRSRRREPKVNNVGTSFGPLQIPSVTASTSGLVIDLTRDSPRNQLLPTELVPPSSTNSHNFRSRQVPGVMNVGCGYGPEPGYVAVIDLSTPSKSSPPKRSIEESPEDSPSKSLMPGCPICLEKLEFVDPQPGKQVTATQCGHMYCRTCIMPILRESERCPTCRRKQTVFNLISLFA